MVKYKFFQDSTILYNVILFFVIYKFFSILILLATWDYKDVVITIVITYIILSMSLLIYMSLFMKRIILSKEGIEVKHFKRQIKFIKWEEFENAYIIVKFMSRYITLEIKTTNKLLERSEKVIEFNINKKRLSSLRKLCSDKELKMKLDGIKLSTFKQKFGPM